MIDLTVAINCIRAQKENGTYRGAKIGRIAKEHGGEVGMRREGEIVLFEEEFDEFQRRRGTLTIETPYKQEEIDKQRRERSLITTVGTIVGVPAGYVEEIRL